MRSQDEIVENIKSILEEKVAPSVAAHNGVISLLISPWILAWLL